MKIAEIYLEGKIVQKNFDEAIKWLNYAVDGAYFRNQAMKIVSEKCFDGQFNAAQVSAAQAWLAKMAILTLESVEDVEKSGVERNCLQLAELYELGLGVNLDFVKAIHWYKKSAALGSYRAKDRLKELGVDWDLPLWHELCTIHGLV